jgi:hypothetical protein
MLFACAYLLQSQRLYYLIGRGKKTSSAHCYGHVLMWAVAWRVRQNISGADKDVTFLEQFVHKIMPVDI